MKRKYLTLQSLAVLILVFTGCFSSPKRPMLKTDIRNQADALFQTANNELTANSLKNAGLHLSQAEKLAMSVDDSNLLCRIYLSALVYRLFTGLPDDEAETSPFYKKDAFYLYQSAFENASLCEGKARKMLLAVCEIYRMRILLSQKNLPGKGEAIAILRNSEKAVSSEPYYYAYLCRTCGDILTFYSDYSAADAYYLSAAKIHGKKRYLSEVALDWYLCARERSLRGNKKSALEAISNALKYDKDAENSAGIASDYFAYAKILVKGSPSVSEKESAVKTAKRASEIYSSAGFETEAMECLSWGASL